MAQNTMTARTALELAETASWQTLVAMPALDTFSNSEYGRCITVIDAGSSNDEWYRICVAVKHPGIIWVEGRLDGNLFSHCLDIS